MRALVQRVTEASVMVNGETKASIGPGLLVFLGIGKADSAAQAEFLARKVTQLRIFADHLGKMNLSVADVKGELLVVSQFTLYGETGKGNRPSYSEAAPPDLAEQLYNSFTAMCRDLHIRVATGVFRAYMHVQLVNDGPVTLMCHAEP